VRYLFENCALDTDRRELHRGARLVPVEPQVFDLLEYLIWNRERVVSKDDLIASIWGGRIVSESALATRINAARSAIGDSGEAQRLIKTLPRKGIRFVGVVREERRSAETIATVSATNAEPAEDPHHRMVAIAVLPFQNLSGDPDQEYFADGLTEDIITELSRQPWFFVIARNSSFAYKGEAVDVRDVAGELGVRYVLEGSVRRSANRVRVTGQLIDATAGNHLWAERYDRELADIFQVQDEITSSVIGSVGPQILAAEAARVRRKPPQSIDAWDLVMQALPHMWRMKTDEHRRAQTLLQQAIELDPDYAHAHALLGWTYISMFNLDSRTPIGAFTDKALEAGARAVELDDQEPWAHLVLGLGHARRRRPELASAHLSRCIELNPSFALGYAGLGYALACGGAPERGLEVVEQAHRLSPRDPFLAFYAPTVRYMALFALGRYEEAVAVCRMTAARHPHHAGAWRLMTVSLALLGRINEAREALAHTLTLQPDLSSAHVTKDSAYADPADRARVLEGLRKAGLKD
jgi:TolB-like protein